ncbi:MAG: thiamine pyrophosphate-dependent enzyme [bacterium]|jgi:2-oxoglutarate ferredoxin oxidoreductase subunit beta
MTKLEPERIMTHVENMPYTWRRDTKPHKFCPGCGHPIILKALGEVIDELNILDRVVYGCDIGCSLLSWDFFNADSIQTHHGRTIPVITGVKRATPEAICIAYMGDGGGYAIGLQHLVSSAIRNEKITTILCNNTVYAMTGGQMAPTTLPEQTTETSPYGRDINLTGSPILGPEMVAATSSANAYIARGTILNYPQLKNFMRRALNNQLEGRGLSFLEVLSSCPTNWRTNAQETLDYIKEKMAKVFPVGEIKVPVGEKEGH